jgi:ABC-2 type transport system permease protein
LLLTALAVVREREIGTLEQLMVSPLRPLELVLGKSLPFGVIGLVDVVVVSLVARVWFGVPFTGDPLLLLGASVLYLSSGLGLGLLVSTVSKTQQEAFLASFLFFMPLMLLSGFMFPVHSMPAVFQWLTWVNPIRHYLEIVRGIFLKDAGLTDMWPQLLALRLLGAALLGLVAARFRKTLA